jgi:hypothetical protein
MSAAPSLAHAFLALSDDDEPPPRRSPAVALAALLAAAVLALGAPLAWLAEHPVAALGAKATAALSDDDG